ncbi:MAG: hypothetical protein K1X38_05080 [Microthrixaceae bacterium]|nr:hypothetical protein [Microthrixaceae bacterium]
MFSMVGGNDPSINVVVVPPGQSSTDRPSGVEFNTTSPRIASVAITNSNPINRNTLASFHEASAAAARPGLFGAGELLLDSE